MQACRRLRRTQLPKGYVANRGFPPRRGKAARGRRLFGERGETSREEDVSLGVTRGRAVLQISTLHPPPKPPERVIRQERSRCRLSRRRDHEAERVHHVRRAARRCAARDPASRAAKCQKRAPVTL